MAIHVSNLVVSSVRYSLLTSWVLHTLHTLCMALREPVTTCPNPQSRLFERHQYARCTGNSRTRLESAPLPAPFNTHKQGKGLKRSRRNSEIEEPQPRSGNPHQQRQLVVLPRSPILSTQGHNNGNMEDEESGHSSFILLRFTACQGQPSVAFVNFDRDNGHHLRHDSRLQVAYEEA